MHRFIDNPGESRQSRVVKLQIEEERKCRSEGQRHYPEHYDFVLIILVSTSCLPMNTLSVVLALTVTYHIVLDLLLVTTTHLRLHHPIILFKTTLLYHLKTNNHEHQLGLTPATRLKQRSLRTSP